MRYFIYPLLNMIDLRIILTIIILSITEAIAFYNLKKFSLNGDIFYYLAGIFAYCIAGTVLAFSFTYSKIGIINLGWNIVSTFYGFIIGYLIFKEKLNMIESIGAIISLIGLVMMTIKLK